MNNDSEEKPEFQWLEDAIVGIFGSLWLIVCGIILTILNLGCAIFQPRNKDDDRT